MENLIPCLAHGKSKDDSCEKRELCERHLAFRKPIFPEKEPIIGAECIAEGHKLFFPASAIAIKAAS